MDHLVALAADAGEQTQYPVNNYYINQADHNLMIVLVVLVGLILLLFACYLAVKLLKKLPKKSDNKKEDVMKELADRKNLRDKLKTQLEAADIDQRADIQARIDKNEKAIKGLEKKAKLPKNTA